MHVLVTGGAGFIGGHLARELQARGCRVRVLDDLSTGRRHNLPAGVRFLRGDLRRPADLEGAAAGVQRVYHLAAAVGPGLVARDPRGTWSRNVEGTARLLHVCTRAGLPLLFASSSEVYRPRRDPCDDRPFAEGDPVGGEPGDRRAVYARSKLAGEAMVLGAARRTGLPVSIARLFNVVGPGQSARNGMVLARFARAARAGRPFPVHGDGRQRRCFLHVADAVRALLALASEPAACGRIVNVGSDEEVSVRALARRVASIAGCDPRIRRVPMERAYGPSFSDPRRRRPDLRLVQALTGWRRRLGLDDAIEGALAQLPAAPPLASGGAPVSISAPKPSARARSTQ